MMKDYEDYVNNSLVLGGFDIELKFHATCKMSTILRING